MWGYPDVSVNHLSCVHIGEKLLSEVISILEKVFTVFQKYINLSRSMAGK